MNAALPFRQSDSFFAAGARSRRFQVSPSGPYHCRMSASADAGQEFGIGMKNHLPLTDGNMDQLFGSIRIALDSADSQRSCGHHHQSTFAVTPARQVRISSAPITCGASPVGSGSAECLPSSARSARANACFAHDRPPRRALRSFCVCLANGHHQFALTSRWRRCSRLGCVGAQVRTASLKTFVQYPGTFFFKFGHRLRFSGLRGPAVGSGAPRRVP